jgi:hypothetical protein
MIEEESGDASIIETGVFRRMNVTDNDAELTNVVEYDDNDDDDSIEDELIPQPPIVLPKPIGNRIIAQQHRHQQQQLYRRRFRSGDHDRPVSNHRLLLLRKLSNGIFFWIKSSNYFL